MVPLRDYATELYARPGISHACLLLQTTAQVDVNLLLFAVWATNANRTLSVQNINDARAQVQAWQEDIVKSIRKVRQRLKSGPTPAPSNATEDLRARLKKLEIEAELIELDYLEYSLERIAVARVKDLRPLHKRVAEALMLIFADAARREPNKAEVSAIYQIAASAQAYAEEGADWTSAKVTDRAQWRGHS